MKPILGYWDSRGVAEPIRILLHFVETDFEDKRYILPEKPPFDTSDWLKDRDHLGLMYPNLPYYIDEDAKVTQSVAILRYLARKHGLIPTCHERDLIIKSDILEQQIRDFQSTFVKIFFHPDYDLAYADCSKKLPQSLKYFSEMLGDRKWFVFDEKLSYVDIMMWEALDHHFILFEELIRAHDNLAGFYERFRSLPKIAEYVESDKFKNTRLYRFTTKSPK